MKVEIAGKSYNVRLTNSPTRRMNIAQLSTGNHLAACGAALGLCTGILGEKPRVTWESCGHSAGAFGERVTDYLLGQGIPTEDIVGAGTTILMEIIRVVVPVTQEAVEEQLGFSEEKEG